MNMSIRSRILSIAAGGLLSAGIAAGCQSSSAPTPSAATSAASPAMLSAEGAKSAAPKKGKAQIWAETCNRCHNTRSPDSYNGKEWAIVMTHMRVRGYLTGEDQRAILEFLQQ